MLRLVNPFGSISWINYDLRHVVQGIFGKIKCVRNGWTGWIYSVFYKYLIILDFSINQDSVWSIEEILSKRVPR